MDLKKRTFVKENKKPFTEIKTTTKHKNLTKIYTNRGALWKLPMQLEIASCLEYGPESFNLKGCDAHAKINVFLPISTAL